MDKENAIVDIQSFMAIPIVDGEEIHSCFWFKVEPEKVTVCAPNDEGKEEPRVFSMDRVNISGFLIGPRQWNTG